MSCWTSDFLLQTPAVQPTTPCLTSLFILEILQLLKSPLYETHHLPYCAQLPAPLVEFSAVPLSMELGVALPLHLPGPPGHPGEGREVEASSETATLLMGDVVKSLVTPTKLYFSSTGKK